ncbi:HAD family hydrolase [Kribbella sp. NPDC051620]|uniref:HAD family hydrolase n=1 Tax=Kribbella sp. NPDC051620 TaxID=3364120 RepID=UPI003798D07D
MTLRYLEQRFSVADLYADTLTTLEALRSTYRLGLLSNGNGYPDRLGLDGIFTAVVFAQDHGVSKPDRRLFEIAAQRIGSAAGSIAMIGDSLVNDVSAAQRAGWMGVWLNRSASACPAGHQPDAEIVTLAELPAVAAEQHRVAEHHSKE